MGKSLPFLRGQNIMKYVKLKLLEVGTAEARNVWTRLNSNRRQIAGSISNSLTLFFNKTGFLDLAESR